MNYPWLHYGHDFGDTAWGHDGVSSTQSKREVETDFEYLKTQGVQVVRWFVFADGRAAPEFDPAGNVTGFDEHFYQDFDAALAIAENSDIRLLPVFFDFQLTDKAKDSGGVQMGGRATMISDSAKRKTFLDNALIPLLQRYGRSEAIVAWDVINEPEGAMDIAGGRWVEDAVTPEAMKIFVREIVQCIHAHTSQKATVGSASRGMLTHWTNSGLDLYQFHYYDKMGGQYPLEYQCANLNLDKPCIVGEFPTKNAERAVTAYLDVILHNGYSGSLAWSLRGDDDSSDFKGVASEFVKWSASHEKEISK
ncbi:MAG: cellulase family glycosylhydrolase [Candidatus Hydrogenedentes bacterium]|nr:cellulase family glycosylhydrolase [Candidatus Hydrogenedentota bacterium]